MSERMHANEIIKQAAIRWYGPAFTLGSAGFGGFILDELKANGYEVVKLPKPKRAIHYGKYMVREWGEAYLYSDGRMEWDHHSISIETCRSTAADLLALAAAAERDSEEQ
ncbi:hypothetical protein HBE99_04380 [Mycobacteroides chelonae]|uniref:hypothetical protein n=1 Tax=Mycobacteroides chelonae TaxID=1774 RepID=UPI0019104676|nr:hypothetical protein [Mycobacteroides chelonae]QQG95453.1 hypothetical protein HBE99_04380 [Mycobacteroides chelonae]